MSPVADHPREVAFHKLSGAGNDFIAVAEPRRQPNADDIRAWCRRGLSVGADGVFTVDRRGRDTVRMTYYNADGERSDLCLNGCRCAARLAFDLGWSDGDLRLATEVGILQARRAGNDAVAVEVPAIGVPPRALSLTHGGRSYDGWHLLVGVPHFVLRWPGSLRSAPVAELGAALRRHPDLGAAGANINFARFSARCRCEVRTFERGVEGETLACGTGVVATVAAGVAYQRLKPPVAVLTAGGFELFVRSEDGEPWMLEGDARIVAEGRLRCGATAAPSPPSWSE